MSHDSAPSVGKVPIEPLRCGLDRRAFLALTSASATAVLAPALLHGATRSVARPVRVTGRVQSGTRGIGGTAVTDGLAVVDTASDGTFELVTTSGRQFVHISLPAGYRIPRNRPGTARFYQPLAPDRHGEMEVVFDLVPLPQSDEHHALLLLADIQMENMEEVAWCLEQTVPDVRQTLAGLGDVEAFGVACGDIMYDHPELFPQYEGVVSRMGIPFFQVVGNHDLDPVPTDRASTATFSRHFGPPYYSFDRGAVHYVVLDDVFWYGSGYLGYLDAEQLAWLEADLRRVEPGRPVVVALHIPVLGSRHRRMGQPSPRIGISVANREALYRLLEPYQAHILSGHTHESEHLFEHGVHEHVSGTVSGAWWSGPICPDGTPSGYSVYEVRGEELRWTYKATGFPSEVQIRAYPAGADPAAPEEIVANVWNWDPQWTVVWYEDGERRGPMARRVGRDPLSVQLHTGPELPPRRPWVEPYPTAHLFYAPTSPQARSVRVEATDRFGRVFTAPVPPAEGASGAAR